MATGRSVIRVDIIGDAKKLTRTLGEVDRGLGGLLKGAAVGFVAFQAVDKAFEAVDSILDNTDRAGDALARISTLIDQSDTAKLQDMAGSFADIGVSAPDFLEIVAGFSEFATASGKVDPAQIADMAAGVATFAGALGRLKDVDPATLGDDIANFITGARGAAAAAKELALPFDSALTPAERYAQLMERLPGLLGQVTGANAGLDDKQATLNAKWETFATQIGPGVEQTLGAVLDVFINIANDIPRTVKGFQDLFGAIEGGARAVLGPLGNVLDLLRSINLASGSQPFQVSPGRTGGNVPGRGATQSVNDFNERNGIARRKVGTVYD